MCYTRNTLKKTLKYLVMRYHLPSHYILRMGSHRTKWKAPPPFFFLDGIRFRCMKNKDILHAFENKTNPFTFHSKGELLNMN